MATNAYMTTRKKYQRPQAMLWANNPGSLQDGLYVPSGFEVGQTRPEDASEEDLLNEFLILSDDNRAPLQFNPVRIEKKERMINGRMRSYHIADKLDLSTSWNRLPSRSFASSPEFDEFGRPEDLTLIGEQYTTDGGAGGVDVLDWYNSYKGSFFVYLAYDKYTKFSSEDPERYSKLGQYNEIIQMYITSFDYSVEKRGGENHDLWNVNVTLEEV